MTTLGWVLLADGAAFVTIGLLVLAAPSPQPALRDPVDAAALGPFLDTRRLLASQFVGIGLVTALVALRSDDADLLGAVACARAATLLVVVVVNVTQLRARAWKPAPLRVLIGAFGSLALAYLVLAARA